MLAHMARRWAWAMTAGLAGIVLVLGWEADVHEAHAQLRQKVQSLKDAAAAVNPPAMAASVAASHMQTSVSSALLARLPAVQDAPGLWLALQKGLQQQGMQIQALRPQALQEGGPLSSQGLAVRLQGRYSDMASAWASLVDAGPVWTLDRLTVTANGPAGQLQWDGLWRVWLRPGAASAQAWPAHWDVADRRNSDRTADPFVVEVGVAEVAVGQAQGASESAQLSADPLHWPLAQIRLLGVWQQADRPQVVLAAGLNWAVLDPGARVALEGYRVKTIYPDAVALQSLKAPGVVQILRLQGVPQ